MKIEKDDTARIIEEKHQAWRRKMGIALGVKNVLERRVDEMAAVRDVTAQKEGRKPGEIK